MTFGITTVTAPDGTLLHLFWRGALSNWAPLEFTVDGHAYANGEQFLMFAKARIMGDTVRAREILKTSDPKQIKALGRAVTPYDDAVWAARRGAIMNQGLLAKLDAHPALAAHLLALPAGHFVEASPYDDVWGIKLAVSDPAAADPARWRGRNLLGQAWDASLALYRKARELRVQAFAEAALVQAGEGEALARLRAGDMATATVIQWARRGRDLHLQPGKSPVAEVPVPAPQASDAPAPIHGRTVASFTGDDRIASNMAAADVLWGDEITSERLWPCVEVPYILAKTMDAAKRDMLEAGFRKVYGAQIAKGMDHDAAVDVAARALKSRTKMLDKGPDARPDWHTFKLGLMRRLVRDKFFRNSRAAEWLLATGDAEIREGNWHGDAFWGVDLKTGRGRNELGRLLMEVRDELRREWARHAADAREVGAPDTQAEASAADQPDEAAPTVLVSLSVIGSAGRKDDAEKMSPALYQAMEEDLRGRIDEVRRSNPGCRVRLVSGGAAFADHLAVRAFLRGECDSLLLHLPAVFDLDRREFIARGGRMDPGRTANWYHQIFSRVMGFDSQGELAAAITGEPGRAPATVVVTPGFHARNTCVADDSDHMVAYTFGTGPVSSVFQDDHPGFGEAPQAGLKDGGTADTWGKAWRARSKWHVNLNALRLALDDAPDTRQGP